MPKQSKVRLKGSRPGIPEPYIDEPDFLYVCTRCGRTFKRQKNNFTPSQSPLYHGNGGYLAMCFNCVDALYKHYKDVLGDDFEAMRRVCMKLDVYWVPRLYEMVPKDNTNNSRFRAYISRLNLQHKLSHTFDDTLDEEMIAAEEAAKEAALKAQYEAELAAKEAEHAEEERKRLEEEKAAKAVVSHMTMDEETGEMVTVEEYPPPDPSVVKFWGTGYTPDYYYKFQERYDRWTENLPKPLDQGTEALYRQVCILEETINRDMMAGKPIEKSVGALNNLLGSLNEKPIQKKKEEALDSDFEQMPLGVGIKLYENYRPIPKPDPMFDDVDGIVRYISIWFSLIDHVHSNVNAKHPLNCWKPLRARAATAYG